MKKPSFLTRSWRRMRFKIHPTVGETAEEIDPYALAGRRK
jgi:hypothetical protein